MITKIVVSLVGLLALGWLGVAFAFFFLPSASEASFFIWEYLYVMAGPLALLTCSHYFEPGETWTIAVSGGAALVTWASFLFLKPAVFKKLVVLPVIAWVAIGVWVLRTLIAFSI